MKMNLNNDIMSGKSALSFVALAVMFSSSCSTAKDIPAFIKGDVDFKNANTRIKVIPVNPADSTPTEEITVDVGQGVKTGVSISFTLNFARGENFKTMNNKDGSPGIVANTTNIKSIKAWLVELDTGSSLTIQPGQSVPSVANTVFAYNNTSVNPTVTFLNVPPNSTGPQKSYYVAVSAHKTATIDQTGSNLDITNNISNTISAINLVMIDGTEPAGISTTGGDGAPPVSNATRAGSVIVNPAPSFTVSNTAPLNLNLKLQDEIGAVIETNITAQSGSLSIAPANINILSGVIETLGGDGTLGNSGNNTPATLAQLRAPGGVALDNSNNIIFTDTNNCTVRKINTSTGIITTIAGTSSCGAGGTGPEATKTNLFNPRGLAIDSSNNIYVADTGNHVIRRFIEGSTMSIQAGVLGVSCTAGACNDGGAPNIGLLNNPKGVALDAANNIYIADTGNHVIRKVDFSGPATISKIAGTYILGNGGDNLAATSTDLSSPAGIALDNTGQVYFSDTGNHIIRKIVQTAPATLERAAGNSTHSLGVGADGVQGTNCSLNFPYSISLDKYNNIFISDTSNNKIRKVNSKTGIIKTYAGTGTGGFTTDGVQATNSQIFLPEGIFVDNSGSLYIADTANNRVRKIQ